MFRILGRGADDKAMRTNAAERMSIYDDVQTMPPNSYKQELDLYIKTKWRRGLISSALGTCTVSAMCGLGYGVIAWNKRFRHVPVVRALFGSFMGFGTVALCSVAVHHWLVMNNNYKHEFWHTVFGGASGGLLFQLGTGNKGVALPMVWTVAYIVYHLSSQEVEKRMLQNFLTTQQNLETPLHKLTPDLQPAYRALIWERKPYEAASDEMRNKAFQRERGVLDSRLDAKAMIEAFNPRYWDWPEWTEMVPAWFPLRAVDETSFNALQEARTDQDAADRLNAMIRDKGMSFAESLGPTRRVNPEPFVDRDPSRPSGQQARPHDWMMPEKRQDKEW